MTYRRLGAGADRWIQRLTRRLAGPPRPGRPAFARATTDLGYAVKTALALRRGGFDIAHVHQCSQFVPVLRALCPRLRIVLHVQCPWLWQLDEAMIDGRLARADLVLGCSDFITDAVRRRFPHHAPRCRTLYNGVDLAVFTVGPLRPPAPPGQLRLLYTGRVSPEKGVHVLLAAWARLAQRYPRLVLDIVGPHTSAPPEFVVKVSDDPAVRDLERFYRTGYLRHLRGMVAGALETRVRFVGAVAQPGLPAYLHRADVFVQPSVCPESFGMAATEAMATGLPVVGSRIGGLVENVSDGSAGLLVPPNDPAALAQALEALLGDAPRRAAMGAAGRRRAEALFSWDTVAAQLAGHYRRLCPASAELDATLSAAPAADENSQAAHTAASAPRGRA